MVESAQSLRRLYSGSRGTVVSAHNGVRPPEMRVVRGSAAVGRFGAQKGSLCRDVERAPNCAARYEDCGLPEGRVRLLCSAPRP